MFSDVPKIMTLIHFGPVSTSPVCGSISTEVNNINISAWKAHSIAFGISKLSNKAKQKSVF